MRLHIQLARVTRRIDDGSTAHGQTSKALFIYLFTYFFVIGGIPFTSSVNMSRSFLKVVNFCSRKTFSLKDSCAAKMTSIMTLTSVFKHLEVFLETFEKVQYTNMVLVIL